MPEIYRGDPVAEKLWNLSERWIAETSASVGYLDRACIMQQLEEAGALRLPIGAALPTIPFGEGKMAMRSEPKPVQIEALGHQKVRQAASRPGADQ